MPLMDTVKYEIIVVVKLCGFFDLGLIAEGNFCRFLTHRKVGLQEGERQVCGMMNLQFFGHL